MRFLRFLALPLLTVPLLLVAACDTSEEEASQEEPRSTRPRPPRPRNTPTPRAAQKPFEVGYSKIATSFRIKQLRNPDSFKIEFHSLPSDWNFSFDDANRGFVPQSIVITGKGVACHYAEANHDLVTCDNIPEAIVAYSRGEKKFSDPVSDVTLTVSRVETSTLQGAPAQPTVRADGEIVVELLLFSLRGSSFGKIHYAENFGGTSVAR